jgi:uncharacterized protein YcnI
MFSRHFKIKQIGLSLALAMGWCATHAHIVLDPTPATAGSYHKATLRVGHGCNGSATTDLTVFIPAGFEGAKPQPKALQKSRQNRHGRCGGVALDGREPRGRLA